MEYINEMHLFIVSCEFRKINSWKSVRRGFMLFYQSMRVFRIENAPNDLQNERIWGMKLNNFRELEGLFD